MRANPKNKNTGTVFLIVNNGIANNKIDQRPKPFGPGLLPPLLLGLGPPESGSPEGPLPAINCA